MTRLFLISVRTLRDTGRMLAAARIGRSVLAAALIAGTGACSSGNDPGAVPRTGASTPRGVARSACELITTAEVAAIIGNAVSATDEKQGASQSTCAYAAATPGGQQFWLVVHWTGGREELATFKTATGIAQKLMSSEGADASKVVKVGPEVPGLGDEAYYNAIMPSYVRAGDVLLEFQVMLLSDGRARFEQLARKALSRV